MLFWVLVVPKYYLSIDGGKFSLQHIRSGSQIYVELMDLYAEIELLPGSVFISNEGGHIRDGKGTLIHIFASNLSMDKILSYYDKELKSKGWSFKDVDISTEWGEAKYVKKGYRCDYLISITYRTEQVKSETIFSLVIALEKI